MKGLMNESEIYLMNQRPHSKRDQGAGIQGLIHRMDRRRRRRVVRRQAHTRMRVELANIYSAGY